MASLVQPESHDHVSRRAKWHSGRRTVAVERVPLHADTSTIGSIVIHIDDSFSTKIIVIHQSNRNDHLPQGQSIHIAIYL